MQTLNRLLAQFNTWRIKNIKESHFVVILSVLVGICTGLAGTLLKEAVHITHHFFTEGLQIDNGNLLFFIYPLIGICLTAIFVLYCVKDNIGHGVTKVLYSISRQNSTIKPHNNYTSMIASTLTIGFGGSVGTEATIVMTGASIGSNLARFFKMNYKVMTLMLGCGAAGAIAGIFNAPIAGIIFTLEVLMLDLTLVSLVPLMISAISSYTVAYFLMGKSPVLHTIINQHFALENIPSYIILGALCGFVAVYFIRMNLRVETWLQTITNPFKRMLIGGGLLGLVIFIFPALYGEGYSILDNIVNGNQDSILNNTYFSQFESREFVIILFTLGLIFVKVIATALTNGSGGVGGVFAPSLFTGGITGFLFATIVNKLGIVEVPIHYAVLTGMAGVMAGVMKSPLTAMFLIAEITNGYSLFVPLMITSAMAYLASRRMEPYSIYARRLAVKGDLITHNKDKTVLTLMKLDNVIERDFIAISSNAHLEQLINAISKSHRNVFPVINQDGSMLGIVLLDDIREIMFDQNLYKTTKIRDLMTTPPTIIESSESMESVMKRFEETGAWNLPVLEDGKYLGFVSKSKIFNTYRSLLQEVSDE